MCCRWLAENTGCKKWPNIHHLGIIAQLCRAASSQLRHVSTIEKKLVKQQYLLQLTAQHGKLRTTNSRASRLSFITAVMSLTGSQPNFVGSLAISVLSDHF